MQLAYHDIHKDIIEQSKGGNTRAQYQLYQLYSKAMFNICIRMLGRLDEAEDLLQESFTEAFVNLSSFRYDSSFGAWLKRIVINRCINHIKKKKINLVLSEEAMKEEAPDEGQPDEEEIQYTVKKVQRAVEQLPEGYRVIFTLYALEGYDHTEIAEIMHVSESTSKSQYMRAKRKLKEIINNMGHDG